MQAKDLIHDELNVAYQALYNVEHQIQKQIGEEITKWKGGKISRKQYWLQQSLTNLRKANAFLTRTGSAHNSAFYFCDEENA